MLLSTWVAVVILTIIVPIIGVWFLIYEEDGMKGKDSQQETTQQQETVQMITKRLLVIVLPATGLIIAVIVAICSILNSNINVRINDVNTRIDQLKDVNSAGSLAYLINGLSKEIGDLQDITKIDSLAYKIEDLKSSIGDLEDILKGREGVLSRLSYIEGETRIRVPVEQSRKIPVSSAGGTFSFGFWDREVNFMAPKGWLERDSILTVTPYAVTKEEIQALQRIGKYKPTKWSFEITEPKQFLEGIGTFTTYTQKDLGETGISDPKDLILLQWSESEQKWKELMTEPVPGTQQLQTKITGPGKYLLGAKVE